jgi:gamma-glutamyltranspeptidase/glutathione hydrolase
VSETLKLESRFAPEVIDELRRRGHDVEVVAPYDEVVGHAGAIVRSRDGLLEGGFDPRSDGGVSAY